MFHKSKYTHISFVLMLICAFLTMLPTTTSRAAGTIDGTNCNFSTLQTFAESGGIVDFTADCTITFSGTINITIVMGNPTNTTINANGHNVVFNGNGNRMFSVDPISSLTINGVTLQGGSATNGGAISVANGSGLTVNNSSFIGNIATDNGGAIYASGGVTITLTNVIFTNNTATNEGGALYANGGITIALTNVTFTNNTATNGGAIRATNGSNITANTATFLNNDADTTSGLGGAIYNNFGSLVTGSNITVRDSDAYDGGAFYSIDGGGLTITGFTLTNNRATNNGGGIYAGNDNSTLNTGYFSGNQAGANGGAIHFANGGTLNLNNFTFSGNSAVGAGGAIYLDFVGFNGQNNIFSGNSAGDTAVIYANAGGVVLIHNTLANNTAGNGRAVHHEGVGATQFASTIVQGGTCSIGAGGAIVDDGNNIAFNAGGCFGLNADPQLGALTANGLLIPAETSPAIDAYTDPCDASDDRLGRSRPFGAGCDIGAVEVRPEDYAMPEDTEVSVSAPLVLGCTLNAPAGVALANAPDDTYCTLLMQNGGVVNYPGAVPQNLIEAGVILAVEIYRLEGGMSINTFPSYARVCLAGSGRLLYMDGRNAPRFSIELGTERLGNSTCGWIPAPGTLILIRG